MEVQRIQQSPQFTGVKTSTSVFKKRADVAAAVKSLNEQTRMYWSKAKKFAYETENGNDPFNNVNLEVHLVPEGKGAALNQIIKTQNGGVYGGSFNPLPVESIKDNSAFIVPVRTRWQGNAVIDPEDGYVLHKRNNPEFINLRFSNNEAATEAYQKIINAPLVERPLLVAQYLNKAV